MSVDTALTLLLHASRVSPHLRDAVAEVDEEIQRLRAEVQQVRSIIALHQQNGCGVQIMRESALIDGSDHAK